MTVLKTVAVIPAYNESATIAAVVARARAQIAHVIVVDDGSTDGTAEAIADSGATVLRNATNQGKAASLWRGMEHAVAAGADHVVTLDGDGQHRPEDIPTLLDAARRHPGQIIIASRPMDAAAMPPLRRFGNRQANFWISWAAGYPIPDSQSGFRVYPTELLQRLNVPHQKARGFVFESEILIAAADAGVRSVPVWIEAIYPPQRRHSHYRPTLDTVRIVRMVAAKLLRGGMRPMHLWRSLRPVEGGRRI